MIIVILIAVATAYLGVGFAMIPRFAHAWALQKAAYDKAHYRSLTNLHDPEYHLSAALVVAFWCAFVWPICLGLMFARGRALVMINGPVDRPVPLSDKERQEATRAGIERAAYEQAMAEIEAIDPSDGLL